MAYHKFKDEDGNEYGSFEVFEVTDIEVNPHEGLDEPGWYWWARFPGCLPDGDPSGPFDSEEEALNDAQEEA